MKVGDLVRASDDDCNSCTLDTDGNLLSDCWCFFCAQDSSRIGVVVAQLNEEGVRHSGGYWSIMFDVGEWRLYGTEAEVLS